MEIMGVDIRTIISDNVASAATAATRSSRARRGA
jgi:hypothetical protein